MFKGDSEDMCAGKFPLVSMRGRAEGLACADPGARTPIGASGIFLIQFYLNPLHKEGKSLTSAKARDAVNNPAGSHNGQGSTKPRHFKLKIFKLIKRIINKIAKHT